MTTVLGLKKDYKGPSIQKPRKARPDSDSWKISVLTCHSYLDPEHHTQGGASLRRTPSQGGGRSTILRTDQWFIKAMEFQNQS